MGFLSELLEKKGMKKFIQFAKSQVKEAYNPFDPLGLDSGPFNAEWRLRLNVSREEILDITNKQY
jgi:predicted transcriptional regulator of viral defense system